MNDPFALLESDWDALLADKKWVDMGRTLRAMIKLQKNACLLSQNQYEIEQRINILEDNLYNLDYKTRPSLISDLIYARRAIQSSATAEFGAAFKSKHSGVSGTRDKT